MNLSLRVANRRLQGFHRCLSGPSPTGCTASIPDRLKSVDTFVFDCDGVIWRGDHLIPGAKEAIARLRARNKNVYFVTNNSTKSREGTTAKFTRLGIPVSANEVLTSSFAAASYLKTIDFPSRRRNKAYVIGGIGICEELSLLGLECVGGPAHANISIDFNEHMEVDPDIGAVVVGLDISLNYYKLQYAQLLLNKNPECLFIATNRDRAFPNKTQLWPGAGSIVASVVGCTGREPIVVGKPSSVLIDYLVNEHNCTASTMCMVGDRLDTDILFGRNHDMMTCLTMSGVTTESILKSPTNEIYPDVTVSSIADLPDLLV